MKESMDLFSLTPINVKNEISKEYQRSEMELVDAQRKRRGFCKTQRMIRDLHVEAQIDDLSLEIRMAPSALASLMLERRYMPQSNGSIILNGKVIGKYLSTRELVVMNPQNTRIRIMPDHYARRFFWARQHGLSISESLEYCNNRNLFLLVERETILSSFCGHAATTSLLTPLDIAEVEKLHEKTYLCIFALCLLWNACCPPDPTLRWRIGNAIPDIPSFSPIEKNGKFFLSLAPEDIARPISALDKIICFFTHRLAVGILIILCSLWLTLAIVSQSAQPDWKELILPSSLLSILLLASFIWPSSAPKSSFHFPAD